ncbi:hypothetical protein CRV15_11605 [Streptomyces clavuligerus]|nr:hypothetical protein D1794_12175 [Streptomyces clavuligerus]EDY47985.1 hypothetical protein SSCG_01013 [Streptomyces clavuligerus]QCS06212.1 hypothetical protein CRV15_11605 [Streptomyces clavuligerus]
MMRQPLSQRSELNPFDFGPCACPRPDCKLKRKPSADTPERSVPREEIHVEDHHRTSTESLSE